MISAKEYESELKRWGIQYDVKDYRIKLFGGDNKARRHYESLLMNDSDLEAMMILQYTNKDALLRELVEERAAIRYADGLPGDLLSAIKVSMRSR